MANLDQAPSRSMPNLLHVLPAFADEAELRLNTIVSQLQHDQQCELITETGHLKLDRVGYSSWRIRLPTAAFALGTKMAIPSTSRSA